MGERLDLKRAKPFDLSREEAEIRYKLHRISYLPTAIDNARRKLAALETEARRYGMEHLL